MKKENLVVLKSALKAEKGHTVFYANKFYRCLPEGKWYLINGENFNKREYESLFETVYDRMIRQFTDLGLIVNGLPISLAKFTKLADIHTYGSGRKAFKIWFFRNSKDVMWGFYPMQDNKKENAKECYMYLNQLIEGNMDAIDGGDVCFGNSGIPICYGKLRIS